MIAPMSAELHAPPRDALAVAREVFAIEAAAVAGLAQRIDASFRAAVDLIVACRGRIVVSGMGKSGHIARKVAATFASTGSAAFFVHPAEASHGDLGMVRADDLFLAFSNSGETAEVLAIVPAIKRLGARLIAVTGNPDSTLARLADVRLDAAVDKEACPHNLAPTASTTAQLALGDALAVAALTVKGFGPNDFARSHPGGSLGSQLLTRVGDIMRSGAAIPCVGPQASLREAVRENTAKRMGMVAIAGSDGLLAGIFTDGDLRRAVERNLDLDDTPVTGAMTAAPRTISPQALATEAVHLMEVHRITQLPVVLEGRLVGAVSLADLFQAKVV
ncbi:MAG: KpsF/GutQ family sugar-phosphate isomerase [Burkholderiales bacterium]|nr:KpsF/GutQ family sugar-phosphate isomerase [Burkholderiales bacterium]